MKRQNGADKGFKKKVEILIGGGRKRLGDVIYNEV
jgi:hypothetical protein